jgi:SAM-dependent methyltransferase
LTTTSGGEIIEMKSTPITHCRLCASSELDLILDLGAQPPANSLRTAGEQPTRSIPLAICRCQTCSAVQLTETVAPDELFRNYVWVTGTSQVTIDYSQVFAERVAQRAASGPLFVVEVASNDGTFLQRFRERGHRVLGVDPAENLARAAVAAGIPTLPDFFGRGVADRLTALHGHADVVIARNVLPHVPDPNDVLAGIAHCLRDDGVGAIEFHWVEKILSALHYDSIYHEHYFYYWLHNIKQLLTSHGLVLFDVTESPISGGSLVAYFSKTARPATAALAKILTDEEQQGFASLDIWRAFAARAQEHRSQLNELIASEIKMGRRLIGYGASARSSTLLNFCGIDHRQLVCIADANPGKQGRHTPGTDVLIVSPDQALNERADAVLLLAWNFQDEILKQLFAWGFRGNVIIPLPGRPQLLRI